MLLPFASNTARDVWRFSIFCIVAFSENNDLDFDAKLSNFFSGKPLGV